MHANVRNSGDRLSGRCQVCNCNADFKKMLHLDTGLVIYLHRVKSFVSDDDESPVQVYPRKDDTIIFHNTSQAELEKDNAIIELRKYKTKCTTCRSIVHRVRSLLEEIRAIRRNEINAICEHCKSTNDKCKRCEYILSKFHDDRKKQLEERDRRFKLWSCKVKLLLETLLKKQGRRRLSQDADAFELEKLLEELKPPLPSLPEIGQTWAENLCQSKEMLQEIILKLKLEGFRKRYASDDSLYVSHSTAGCACANCKSNLCQGRNTVVDLSEQIPALQPQTKFQLEEKKSELIARPSKVSSLQPEPSEETTKSRKKPALEPSLKSQSDGEKSKTKSKSSKVKSSPKSGPSEDTTKSKKANKDRSTKKKIDDETGELDLATLMKKAKAEQSKKATEDKAKSKKSKEPSPLPKPKKKLPQKPAETFNKNKETGSIFGDDSNTTSDVTSNEATPKIIEVMIKGIKIIPLEGKEIPFEKDNTIDTSFLDKLKCSKSVQEAPGTVSPREEAIVETKEQDRSGVITYKLSDRKFIDNGWTRLPTMKVFRRMNIYKMLPSSPGWFEQHNDKTLMYYGSGETLAQIDIGGGKWFYKNGSVALDYYDFDDEKLVTRRYMVYSHEDDSAKPQTILACFDYLGNGIVFDKCGNERLKYNQSEGIVIDKKIGPPGLWKWHSLNDPPIFQRIFVDTLPKIPSPELEEIIRKVENKNVDEGKQCKSHVHMHPLDTKSKSLLHCGRKNDDMLEVELQNYAKQKHRKLMQKFQRFEIRMKAVKINDHFSLRVVDQANIYLLFRDRALTLKLNLGMLLQSDEMIDVHVFEMNSVTTPYDKDPPKSKCFKRVHDAFLAARESVDSRQMFLTKRPMSSSTVCPLPPLSSPSNVGSTCTLSPPHWGSHRCNVNLPRWRSADSYRQARSSPLAL